MLSIEQFYHSRLATTISQPTGIYKMTPIEDGELPGTRLPPLPHQQELLDWFQKKAPHLREIYEAALLLVARPTFPARLYLVAHTAREIGNRLPDAIGVKREVRIEYVNRLNDIVDICKTDGLPLDITAPANVSSTDAIVPVISLPLRTAQAITDLIRDHANNWESRKDAAIRLLREIAPDSGISVDELRPAAFRWIEIQDWFLKIVHVRNKEFRVDEYEFLHHFRLFEQYLGSMLRPFFSTIKELDAFLDEANR